MTNPTYLNASPYGDSTTKAPYSNFYGGESYYGPAAGIPGQGVGIQFNNGKNSSGGFNLYGVPSGGTEREQATFLTPEGLSNDRELAKLDFPNAQQLNDYINKLTSMGPDALSKMKLEGIPDEHSLDSHLGELNEKNRAMASAPMSQAIQNKARNTFSAENNRLAQRAQIQSQLDYQQNLQTANDLGSMEYRIAIGGYQNQTAASMQMAQMRGAMLGNLLGIGGNLGAMGMGAQSGGQQNANQNYYGQAGNGAIINNGGNGAMQMSPQ